MRVSLFLTYLFCVASAFYDNKDDVVELTEASFQGEVVDSENLWIVEFYAPWCGHCKTLIPEWKQAATALKGIVNVGAVDATQADALSKKYGVNAFPTILAISKNLPKPVTFEGTGKRDATALASWALAQAKEVVKSRLGIKSAPKKQASSKSDVVEVTQATFDAEVMQYEGLVLAEFYAPWCGHCKNLAPEWKKAATALKAKGVKLVAIDATIHGTLASKYGVQGYPTIKVFAAGPKGEPTDFQGPRDSDGIVQAALGLLGEKLAADEEPSAVIELTDANFDEQVLNSSDLWMVEFFAPWCGHCKTLAPHWKTAASQLEGKVKIATVDATVQKALADRYQVTGFPTIKVFGADKTNPEIYEGARVSAGIVSAAEELLKEMQTPPRAVVELTSDSVLQEQCGNELCLVAFLPHILDSGAQGRQEYLSLLANEAKKAKKQKLGFVWSEALSQPELENILEVGEANYPSLQAVSLKKGLRIPFQSAFSAENVADFMKRVASGKAAPLKVKSVPKLQTITPWDGKDGAKAEL